MTIPIPIACIVEGDGEVQAVPILLRRLAQELRPDYAIDVPYPIRVPRDKLLKDRELERYFEMAVSKAEYGGVLILIDADDPVEGCPATLGPSILERVTAMRADVPTLVVIAKNEYEAWFLASAESLRSQRGLGGDIEAPPDPEAVRGAKEWLRDRRQDGRRYSETLDQPALTARFDIQAARRAPSFNRLYLRFGALCDLIAGRHPS
jgi:hypothetical protein